MGIFAVLRIVFYCLEVCDKSKCKLHLMQICTLVSLDINIYFSRNLPQNSLLENVSIILQFMYNVRIKINILKGLIVADQHL